VSTLASAPPGNYTLTLTGTSGNLTHSTTVSFVISGVPAGWTDVDIGSPGMVGSATYNAGTFTVSGGGADIWYASDQFNYVYQSLTGDLTITARVASQQNTDSWAKAGVMIRETTAANASYVSVLLTPAYGVNMQYRPVTGGNAVHLAQVAALVAPYWVRLVRSGNTFTGYSSADGVTWTQVGSISLTMASSATAGLVVTAHNNSLLNASTFDNVGITRP
jgi:regulation of enolase protein 1 (concanavalin A-like superfamily)